MRKYTNEFPQADQEMLECKFDAILKMPEDSVILSTRIVTELLGYWKADHPAFVILYANLVNDYLYNYCETLRKKPTGADLLFSIMKRAYPQFLRED